MATNKDVKETMEVNQEVTQAAEEKVVDPNELVEIHLFEDGDRYKDDVFVAVNGKTFQIKRGETVEVPECVAEVLRHQEEVLEEIVLFEGKKKKG